ncbi:VOC family protein [Sphingobium estronivorans]|uniref:VOC family protein n=1 Tax=Sphingobium estronivorans TaxID=1577690 RepID=UPI00123A9C96|nr:VOC family protein [Sphingobium estronivorans]
MTAELAVAHLDVGLVANDRTKALAFWHELLGFPLMGEISFPGMTIIRLSVGDAVLRIVVPDAPVERTASTGGFASETGLRYITLQVNNLEAIVEAARAGGYPVPHPPREIRPGTWAAQIEDGAGATVELQQVSA